MTQNQKNSKKIQPNISSKASTSEQVSLEQKALKSKKWQLTMVNYTILGMSSFYIFVWVYLQNWGPAIVCATTAVLATIAHLLIKTIGFKQKVVLFVLSNGFINILFLNLMLWFQLPIVVGYITMAPIFAMLLQSTKVAKIWTVTMAISIIATILGANYVDWGTWVKPIDATTIQYLNAAQGVTLVVLGMLSVTLIEYNYSKLISILGRQNDSIQESKQQLEKAQQYKDRFFATITHELRTPMNAIVGIVNLLRSNQDSQFNVAEYNELTKSLGQSSNQLLTIINDLLDLSKLQENKLSINPADFDLREILYNSYNILKYLAQEKNIDYELHISSQLPKLVRGDGHRITQVLVNILSNSVKFTDKGSVKMKATQKVDVDDPYKIYLQIEISDTGIGIKKSIQEHLFSEFVQANDSIAMQYGGTGLGLSISKRLIELMDGKIAFKSKEGVGTVFQVTVPLEKVVHSGFNEEVARDVEYKASTYYTRAELLKLKGQVPGAKTDALAPNSSISPTQISQAQHKKILIVDDNKINLLVAQKQIERNFAGIQIMLANHGAEAVQLVIENDFDLVLMDMQMPIMNGIEATIEIRKLQNRKKALLPIVAMTANAGKAEIQACMDAGMNDSLIKPFALSSLVSLLNHFLQLSVDVKN